MTQDDRQFESHVRAELEASLENLDPTVTRRLQQARHKALSEVKPVRFPVWQPAIGFAMATLLILAVVVWPVQEKVILPAPALVDFELIAADDSLQLFEELDFYEWLAESDLNAG